MMEGGKGGREGGRKEGRTYLKILANSSLVYVEGVNPLVSHTKTAPSLPPSLPPYSSSSREGGCWRG